MALMNCPECGAQVSEKAVTCPNCGHPIMKVKGAGFMQYGWIGVAVIALILALFTLLNTCNWKPVV